MKHVLGPMIGFMLGIGLLSYTFYQIKEQTKLAVAEGYEFVDTDPFPNCRSCSYGLFEKEGQVLKLAVNNETLDILTVGTSYDLTYEVESFDYPNHELVEFQLSSTKK